MIRFLFIVMLIPAGACAQWTTLPPQSFIKKPAFIIADTLKPALDRNNTSAWLAQGKRMHRNKYGTVYSMPPDNMPCIVPPAHVNAPMPAKRVRPAEPMPNGITPPRLKQNKE